MARLLCIAIPTYNRAELLDRQLEWLSRNIASQESLCEIILSDNASTDDTPAICERWRGRFETQGVPVTVIRNPTNVGPLPNIRQCFERSRSRFTWAIGDDDDIQDGVLSWVIRIVRGQPDLAAVLMNFSCSGETTLPRCYDFGGDLMANGRQVMAECLRQNEWGLAILTALVFRTEFAQAAYRIWPEGIRNEASYIFVTVSVALRGPVYAAHRVMMDYVTGSNFYRTHPQIGMQMIADTVEVLVRLKQMGFAAKFIRQIAFKYLWSSKVALVQKSLRVHPRHTVATAVRLARYVRCLTLPDLAPTLHP